MRRRAGVFVALVVLGVLPVGSTAHAEDSLFKLPDFRIIIDGRDDSLFLFRPPDFRFAIDGLADASAKVSKVDAITIKQTTADYPNLKICFDAQELLTVVPLDPYGDLIAEFIVPQVPLGDHEVTLVEKNPVINKGCVNVLAKTTLRVT